MAPTFCHQYIVSISVIVETVSDVIFVESGRYRVAKTAEWSENDATCFINRYLGFGRQSPLAGSQYSMACPESAQRLPPRRVDQPHYHAGQ